MHRFPWAILLILGLFAGIVLTLDGSGGTDISASYVSCRLILTGESSHLYAHDPTAFNTISDPVWTKVAATRGVPAGVLLSPFVQTPLWPYILQPLCKTTTFETFNWIFSVAGALCFAGMIWLTGRHWAPLFFTPLWVSFMAAIWVKADPLREAQLLTQTHIIFVLLTLIAIEWARSGHELRAGAFLAIAATVKVIPGVLVIYWLITKKKKAALSFAVCFAALLAVTVIAAGREVVVNYLHSMSRISNMLLLSENNQSLAAWWLGHYYPSPEIMGFRSLKLPFAMKLLCSCLVVLTAMVGGYCDRRLATISARIPPYGAIFALLGGTIFAPIAWSHYYVLLVVPLILMLDYGLRRRSYPLLLISASIFFLANTKVLLRQLQHLHFSAHGVARGQFYAGVLALVGMLLMYQRSKAETAQQ